MVIIGHIFARRSIGWVCGDQFLAQLDRSADRLERSARVDLLTDVAAILVIDDQAAPVVRIERVLREERLAQRERLRVERNRIGDIVC